MKSTLARVLEPEVMDAADEARDYDAMDHAEVNRRFVAELLAAGAPTMEGEVLDLGCGTAQIPIELCRICHTVRVLGVDMAASMLELGRRNVTTAGLHRRIRLEQADAKTLPYEDDRFAVVISNSIIHHIPHPQAVLCEAARVAAHGGLIFIRDLMRPADEATVKHFVQAYAADANDHQRALFDASLRAALSLDEIRALIAAMDYDPMTVNPTSDRHWTWVTRKAIGTRYP